MFLIICEQSRNKKKQCKTGWLSETVAVLIIAVLQICFICRKIFFCVAWYSYNTAIIQRLFFAQRSYSFSKLYYRAIFFRIPSRFFVGRLIISPILFSLDMTDVLIIKIKDGRFDTVRVQYIKLLVSTKVPLVSILIKF